MNIKMFEPNWFCFQPFCGRREHLMPKERVPERCPECGSTNVYCNRQSLKEFLQERIQTDAKTKEANHV